MICSKNISNYFEFPYRKSSYALKSTKFDLENKFKNVSKLISFFSDFDKG